MKLTFLGTGTSQGVPLISCHCSVCLSTDPKDKRLRSSVFVQCRQTKIVIDCGPDFRQQILKLGEWNLDAILLTHQHNDHVAGLDELRSINHAQQRPFPIYLTQQVEQSIRSRYDYAFSENHPGVPCYQLNRIKAGTPFRVNDILIEPLLVHHGTLDILGFKIADLVYITDAKKLPAQTIESIKNCNTLVINALRQEPHNTHFDLNEALQMIKYIMPKQAFISHMSHKIGLHQAVQASLPDKVSLAYDGLELIIS